MKDNLKAGLLRNSIKSDRRLISDTEELILICAGLNHDENMLPRAKELISGRIDWKFFKENALRSGLYLIIYNSLKKIDRESAVPKDILVLLKAAHLCAVSKTGIQYNETAHLLKLFFKKNIPIVPLKGPLLARRLYGDIAARGVSTDIDLLIEEKNIDKAREILGLAGYAASSGEIWNIIGQQPFGKEDRSTIDLQWQINPVVPNNERMKGFWDGTRLRQEDGVSYHEFKEAELLLQLSVHFVDSSHLIQLKHICDIHELLTRFGGTMQWDGVIEKAF
ncbi:MAG: nucleotidyltransferase family protein [Candidatus Omnitrophica bacterium]|nr:nucleotidyltransferase family protein [Candidatus Omnitrophota bacterium]